METILFGGVAGSKMVELRLNRLLLIRNWKVRFRHISRSLNEVADQMEKYALNGVLRLLYFEYAPSSIL